MNGEHRFYNLSEQNMDFERVFTHICNFIERDPRNLYRLSIGTDSQAHQKYTRFITAIHLHRVGKGAWGCLRQKAIHKKPPTLREKIYLETQFSQEIACLFTPDHIRQIWDLLHPYGHEGAGFVMEIHLDIGNDGLTKEFILDMTMKVRAMGLTPKIKPDAYAAFSYANRYTK
ncbi:ribonuclease H-like YkuK family protein [Bacillus sp. DX1.1]|uniref:ribonuclease H-like YkuK family protein n=1 Tax=unclassified Bacillus (in: firmicutes) TaxID=185979 RepID=UPI0025711FB0|nr:MULTISPECIES: ribonuclease H-like YkuK family protein [unclassified Bacillus (in: firmicutes)]MDM5156172.1 ribonuclease H-like YkuK family protein [Bacillus sp. DX1.1]WJE80455.1 ribonuclease H-like YkuK family protein [Bacillus sp. DX3.1]